MKNVDFSVRELLSTEGQKLFDDVAYQKVLGASTHIRLISEMMQDLCVVAAAQESSAQDFIINVSRLNEFFYHTRGEASQAISNAIDLMTSGLKEFKNCDLSSAIEYLTRKIDDFHQNNKQNLDKINQYATSLLSNMDSIMLFDYSSTVGRMVDNYERELNILIPESRVLDGGKPYIEKGRNSKHKKHFIPDAAMLYYLKKCDGVFIGSETLYPDGRVFNTVGSEMLAFLCKSHNVPFYVLTTLLKIDMRSKYGYQKPPVMIDLKEKFASMIDPAAVDAVIFSCPELVEIPAEFITALITERGIVPPSAINQLATDYIGNNRENQK